MSPRQTKYIFVTGGVMSSLGKGLASASIGALLEARSLGRGALVPRSPPKPQASAREELEAEVSALKSQVEALLRERDPRGKGSGSGARPDWQHPGRRATIPSTPPPVRGNQPRESRQRPGADDVESAVTG